MKNLMYIILIFLSFENVYTQDLNADYMLFSNSKENSEYIEFINDSTLIRKPYYSNAGCGLAYLSAVNSDEIELKNIYKEYKYSKKNDTITIFEFNDSKNFEYFITDNKYFENSNTKEVYVLRKKFEKFPNLAVKYNENYYWLDSPESANGIITKDGKKNRKLSRILKNKDSSELELTIYKEYEAFERFGYEYIFGIIEIKEKKR